MRYTRTIVQVREVMAIRRKSDPKKHAAHINGEDEMKIGDLVRYRQGSLDKVGIVTGQKEDGDYWVQFANGIVPCRWRCLEVLSECR